MCSQLTIKLGIKIMCAEIERPVHVCMCKYNDREVNTSHNVYMCVCVHVQLVKLQNSVQGSAIA